MSLQWQHVVIWGMCLIAFSHTLKVTWFSLLLLILTYRYMLAVVALMAIPGTRRFLCHVVACIATSLVRPRVTQAHLRVRGRHEPLPIAGPLLLQGGVQTHPGPPFQHIPHNAQQVKKCLRDVGITPLVGTGSTAPNIARLKAHYGMS